MKRGAALALAGLVALLALAPRRACATAEEFSTFNVEPQEEDDESALDHLLTRPPREWREEWERAPQAFRTSEGCLTSGQWFELNDLKIETALGRQARFAVANVNRVLLQTHANEVRLNLFAVLPEGQAKARHV